MKLVDLTHCFDQEVSVSSLDEAPSLKTVKTIEKDGYGDSLLHTTMHIGTHIDAPSHMLDSHKMVSDYPLDTCIGQGVLIDVRNLTRIDLTKKIKQTIKKDTMVLFYSGMDAVFNQDNYFENHPVLSDELVDYLIDQDVKCILLDFFSPDRFPYAQHKKLLAQDILIVENITNAACLLKEPSFELYAIPMKLKAEGAFVRVFAKIK